MNTKIDDSLCPLCQLNNQCGVNDAEPCWCTTTEIASELLKNIPVHLRNKSCICKSCADKFNLEHIKEVK
ncbi:cysteine-rich CWC family protein [Colwelliaceae bacterium 6441]